MKKGITIVLAALAAACSLGISACDEQELPHECVWGAWETLVAPSCETDGVEIRYCADDATHFEEREISSVGHTIEEWFAVEDGHVGFCGECGKDTDVEDHDFKNGKCTLCGETQE